MNHTDQGALPLWAEQGADGDYAPLFATGEHIGHVDEPTWRGTVVQVVYREDIERHHFWVTWKPGLEGGPHEHTAAQLRRLPKLSGDARRTERQAEHLASGMHPLAAALGWPLKLHADAAPADDRQGPGRRCGGCTFRQVIGWRNKSYAKCTHGDDWPRATHGAGTDVRAWWPACVDHQPEVST